MAAQVSRNSGLVTVRLPRAVTVAESTGYCDAALLQPLSTAGTSGKLAHHCLRNSCDVWTDPGNAAGLTTVEKTGSSLWYAATKFIDQLLEAGFIEPGCRVCEVGAGCGAVGLALHFGLGCSVTLTDQPQMLPLLYLNAGHNAHRLHRVPSHAGAVKQPTMPSISALPWGDEHAAARVLAHQPGGFDLIVGSDVTYDPAGHDALLHTLAQLAHGRQADPSVGSRPKARLCEDGDVPSSPSPLPSSNPPSSSSSVRSSPALVLLAAPDWQQPGQTVSSFLREGFLDRAAQLGWRFEVLRTGGDPGREWLGGSGGASKSTVCPVVILRGKPPPLPHRSRVMACFDQADDNSDDAMHDGDDFISTGPTGVAMAHASSTTPSLY